MPSCPRPSASPALRAAAGSGAYPNVGTLTFSAGGVARSFNFSMDADDTSGFLSEAGASGTQASGRIKLQTAAGFADFHAGRFGDRCRHDLQHHAERTRHLSFTDNNNTQHDYIFYLDGVGAAYFVGLSAAVEIGRAEAMTVLPANQTVQSIGGPYAYGTQFVYPGATAPPPAQVTFDNSPSSPTMTVAGGPSATYNVIASGAMWQGQIAFPPNSRWLGTGGMLYLAVSPTQLMFLGSTTPYANVVGFLLQ